MMRSRSNSAVFPGSLRQRTGRLHTTPPGVLQPIVRSKPDDAESSSPSFDPRPLSEWMRESAFATQDIQDERHAELLAHIEQLATDRSHRLQSIQTVVSWGVLILGALLWWRS